MPARAKTWIVAGVLAALTAWPAVHLWLAFRFDVSPWKLCGWGMYATPRFDAAGMEIYGEPAAGGPPVQLTAPTPAERTAATRFLEDFRWLRRLAPRAHLVRAVLDAHPEWAAIELVVFRPHMDAATGMVRTERTASRHRRD